MSKRLAALQETINKKYKGNYVVRASDPSAFNIRRIPTGVFALDAITYGGVPFGRISILWGEFSSGKTSAALKTVARAQRTCRSCLSFMRITKSSDCIVDDSTGEILLDGSDADSAIANIKIIDELRKLDGDGTIKKAQEDELQKLLVWFDASVLKDKQIHFVTTRNYVCDQCKGTEPLTAVWIDAEGAFDKAWARNFGIDTNELWVVRPNYAEQVIDIMNHIIRTGECDLLVLDSVAAMVPAKEVENSAEKAQQALMARLMNKAIRTWVAGMAEVEVSDNVTKAMPTILLINQVREKVGVFYGDPSIMPGGKGQSFGNSLTVKLYGSKYAFDDDTGETWSRIIKANITKSKTCPPRESAEYVLWLRNHDGHKAGSTEEEKVVLQQALKEGVIQKDKSNNYRFLGNKCKTQKEILAKLFADEMLLEAIRVATLEAMVARKLRSAT